MSDPGSERDPDRGVDFIDHEPDVGGDEELPQRTSGRWRLGPLRPAALRPRVEVFLRGRYGLPLVVVVAVLAFLVARALLHEQPAGAPPATRSPVSGRTGTLDARTGRVLVDLPRRTGSDPTRCPGLRCYTSASVPAAVRAAVRAEFPTVRFTASETIRLVDRVDGNPLWYREVVARTGSATLTLRVQAHSADDTPDGDARDDGSHSVTFLYARLEQYFVRAQVVDRSGTVDVLDKLSALIGDDRLVST